MTAIEKSNNQSLSDTQPAPLVDKGTARLAAQCARMAHLPVPPGSVRAADLAVDAASTAASWVGKVTAGKTADTPSCGVKL